MPSITVMFWFGVAAIWFCPMSETAPASMSSCGWFIALTCWRWSSERNRVKVVFGESMAPAVTSPRERPPMAWPSGRTCIRSYLTLARTSGSLKVTFRAPVPVL